MLIHSAGMAYPETAAPEQNQNTDALKSPKKSPNSSASAPQMATPASSTAPASTESLLAPDIDTLDTDSLLTRLRGEDTQTRQQAFAPLRNLDRDALRAAWERSRNQPPPEGWEYDCLLRAWVQTPPEPIHCRRAICLVIGPGYEAMLCALLDTLRRFGQPSDTQVVVFAVDAAAETLAGWPDIRLIPCRSVERVCTWIKGVLFSAARFIEADHLLLLETDLLILGSLEPLWATLATLHTRAIVGVRPQYLDGGTALAPKMPTVVSVRDQLGRMGAEDGDLEFVIGQTMDQPPPFAFNGGLLGGSRQALLALDAEIRSLQPFASLWMEGGPELYYGDEWLMNLAVGRLGAAVEVAGGWNRQIYGPEKDLWIHVDADDKTVAFRHAEGPVSVLHVLCPARLRGAFWEYKRLLDARELR